MHPLPENPRPAHRARLARQASTLALLAVAATLTMGARRCERHNPRPDGGDGGAAGGAAEGCIYDGKHYEVGEGFPSNDGCNSCSCTDDGQVACTLRACLPEDSCGGGPACAGDEYCQPAANAVCNDLAGSCQPRPEACDAIYDPVCGCDGKTYGSDCDAALNGVAVKAEGECDGGTDPEPGEGCDYNGEHYAPGASFPSDDGCNTCTCIEGGTVGCTKRACVPNGTCGGLAGGSCPDGEYCAYPEDAICGAADAPGTCAKKPDACTQEYNPVCGCDDKTYGNACSAAAAGVSIAKQGECDGTGSGAGSCELGDTEFEVGTNVVCSDGCNQCTCAKDGWISTLVACQPLPTIELCDDSERTEGLDVTALYRDGDALALSIAYGGGCFDHTFKLCHSGAFLESSPVQMPIRVVDTTGKVDSCLAIPTVQRVFDLTPLRELYTANYPGGPNTVVLNVGKEQVEYSF